MLIEEDKSSMASKQRIESSNFPKLNYFIQNDKLTFLFNLSEQNFEICIDYFLKFLKHIIKEIKNKDFLNNRSIIDVLRNILINLNCYLKIEENSLRHIKQNTSELLYEIAQKFFDFPNLISYMTIRCNDLERHTEENLIFSMILNLFKDDQYLPDRASKKNVLFKLYSILIYF